MHPLTWIRWIRTLGLFFALAASSQGLAAIAQDKDRFQSETIPLEYREDYIFLLANQDVPIGRSTADLQTGQAGYGFDYHHHLGEDWMVGVGYRIKSMKRKEGGNLSFMSFTNHTQRVFRLYHPLYLLMGTEWSYLMPTAQVSLPPVKDPDYATEIAIGLNGSLWLYLSPRVILELRTMRWRGTKTNRLHGWQSDLGIGWAF